MFPAALNLLNKTLFYFRFQTRAFTETTKDFSTSAVASWAARRLDQNHRTNATRQT